MGGFSDPADDGGQKNRKCEASKIHAKLRVLSFDGILRAWNPAWWSALHASSCLATADESLTQASLAAGAKTFGLTTEFGKLSPVTGLKVSVE